MRSLDAWIDASKQYHVNEQSLHSLRAAVRAAGFADVRAWIGADVLRSGGHDLTSELAASSYGRPARRLLGSRPVRLFAGNDLYAVGSR